MRRSRLRDGHHVGEGRASAEQATVPPPLAPIRHPTAAFAFAFAGGNGAANPRMENAPSERAACSGLSMPARPEIDTYK